jgi:hypothetical protein
VYAPRHRLIALAALLVWMAPSLVAASTLLHLALAHHGEHGEEAKQAIAELALAAAHGHHHDLATPEHGHEVSLLAPVTLAKPLAAVTLLPSPPVAVEGVEARSRLEHPSRRAPPPALFTTHCALLL